jgi:flagellar hook-length control protein FliK
MKSLNLSQDQLNQLLSDQGMTAADLLQTDKLQQLILANSGQTDILAALTDENLADTMKQLLQTVDEIKANNNIGLTGEQIKAILSKVDAQSKAKTDTSKETVTEETPVTAKEDQTEQSEVVNTANVARDTKTKTVTKTVTEKSITTETVKQAVTGESFTGSETGTGSEANSDLNTPNQFQNFVDNLVKASTSTQVDFTGDMVQVTELRQIANQIIDKIKVSIAPNQTSMELQLNPENLGKVSLSVQSKNGEMTAQFIVQNEISKEAIESQMQTLRDALNQQGIKVESIEVTVSANAFEQSSREGTNEQAEAQKDNTGKKITLEEALNMTEATEEENSTNQDVTGITGSMIDYTA